MKTTFVGGSCLLGESAWALTFIIQNVLKKTLWIQKVLILLLDTEFKNKRLFSFTFCPHDILLAATILTSLLFVPLFMSTWLLKVLSFLEKNKDVCYSKIPTWLFWRVSLRHFNSCLTCACVVFVQCAQDTCLKNLNLMAKRAIEAILFETRVFWYFFAMAWVL